MQSVLAISGFTEWFQQINAVWPWAFLVLTGAMLVAGVMVHVQTTHRPASRGVVWAIVIVVIPILGPLVYIIHETLLSRRRRREAGLAARPEKGAAELRAPEEIAADEAADEDESPDRRTDSGRDDGPGREAGSGRNLRSG